MKILLTEDNKVSRQLALLIFDHLGHHVDVATNGEEAVKLWRENKYDLIFMDIVMPGINGYDATRMIRSFEDEEKSDHRTVIIAITAKQNKGEYAEAMEAGMDDYLTKPINETMISEVIAKWYKSTGDGTSPKVMRGGK